MREPPPHAWRTGVVVSVAAAAAAAALVARRTAPCTLVAALRLSRDAAVTLRWDHGGGFTAGECATASVARSPGTTEARFPVSGLSLRALKLELPSGSRVLLGAVHIEDGAGGTRSLVPTAGFTPAGGARRLSLGRAGLLVAVPASATAASLDLAFSVPARLGPDWVAAAGGALLAFVFVLLPWMWGLGTLFSRLASRIRRNA